MVLSGTLSITVTAIGCTLFPGAVGHFGSISHQPRPVARQEGCATPPGGCFKVVTGKADPGVVVIYEKAWDEHSGDKDKICTALGLDAAKWTDGMDKAAFVKKFLG